MTSAATISPSTAREVAITAPATLARAAAIHDQLLAATLDADRVSIRFENDTVDLAVLQLILATDLHLQKRGGAVSLASPPSDALRDVLCRGGFDAVNRADTLWNKTVNP